MDPRDLAHFAELLKARSGIELDASKDYLVTSRLGVVAATEGFDGVPALLSALRTRPTERMIAQAVDAMTTNETFFFRDQTPFDHLRRIMVDPARRREGTLRIWSAACSTGQEPYSIAMLWDEVAHHVPGLKLEILATDLSQACLAKARSGLYTPFEVQRGLPVQKLMKHFQQEGPNYQAKPELRATVAWRQHNLLESPAGLGQFHVVLCRNVLIYFDRPTRTRVLEGIARQLAPGGWLLLGAAETVLGLTDAFKAAPEGAGLYVKADAPQARAPFSAAG